MLVSGNSVGARGRVRGADREYDVENHAVIVLLRMEILEKLLLDQFDGSRLDKACEKLQIVRHAVLSKPVLRNI